MKVLDFPSLGLRFEIIVDASLPANTYEVRCGDQSRRVRWPDEETDEETEVARWADDGGAPCE